MNLDDSSLKLCHFKLYGRTVYFWQSNTKGKGLKKSQNAPACLNGSSIFELDALGTHWWIETLDDALTDEIKASIVNTIRVFERQYTRFSDDSLLGQLNLHKRLMAPPVEMLAMLEFAGNLQDITGGVFNISVGGELVRRGYGKTGEGRISASFWGEVKLTPVEIRIPGGISLDFGGFGKGWLIDSVGDLLKDSGKQHFIINGGGDILVNAPMPLEFALEHPLDSCTSIGTTRIQNGALAVSSNRKRTWQHQGKNQQHIIDPRTSAPATSADINSTYVRAKSALIADACATILLIAPELDEALTQKYGLKTILLNSSQLSHSN
ncbi:FAD:protein FMN transferase [Candidatus Saccharibacteria bacterium]|nr:MAG: FAD:protein FMN transferase [Candidatus Saccharibacteria bacterium]